jgi:serine phosphatase RsbU (regulator of sigma subunit)
MIIPASTNVGRLSLESRHLPAAQGGGGDIHDAMATPFGIRLLIGDVMGTGEPAHQTGLSVLNAWRELACTEPALAAIAVRLHTLIARSEHPERFVTALLVNFPADRARAGDGDPVTGSRAELVCCGHPPPLLLRGGSAAFIEPYPAPPLGLLDLTGGCCQPSMFGVEAGDQLLLYTDGVSEARDAAGRFFPLADRTAQALSPISPAAGGAARPHLLDELVTCLADHVGGRVTDDVLLLLASMSLATPQAGPSWGIVITSPRAADRTGMKLCRGESTRRGGRTWRFHRCLSEQRGRHSSGITTTSPPLPCVSSSPPIPGAGNG